VKRPDSARTAQLSKSDRVAIAMTAGILLVLVSTVVALVTFGPGENALLTAMGAFLLCGLIPIIGVASYGVIDGTEGQADAWRREALILALAALAARIAGGRHAHLRDAWAADLYGDLETTGDLPSAHRRMQLAEGFVVAALRCRLNDVVALAWQPVDTLLGSWRGSQTAICLPATVAVGLILAREGLYGLISNAENLAVIAAVPYAAIKGLRKYRQIDTPKRPEKKTSTADSKKQ
jgi:hypothetical protein